MGEFSCRFKPHWNEYTDTEHEIIRCERESNKSTFCKEEKCEYGYICPACTKPNRLGAHYCTRCYFPHDEWDIAKLPSNVFLDIIQGKYTETPVLYRDDNIMVFDDKFGVSKHHIDVIPIEVIEDISNLDGSHVDLIEKMYKVGKQMLVDRKVELYEGYNMDDLLVCGFNWPVSVKHLHLHLVLPPFFHRNCFKSARWHSYSKVINDLKTHGKVLMYKDHPNDEEVKGEYDRAFAIHDMLTK